MSVTLADVRNLAQAWASVGGSVYTRTDTDWNTLINNTFRQISEETRALYTERESFTLQSGRSLYYMEGTTNPVTTGVEWCDILEVYVDDTKLTKVSMDWLRAHYPNITTADSSKPRFWALMAPNKLYIWPTPDQAYSNCYVTGYKFHATLSSDTTAIEFPQSWWEDLAVIVAKKALGPFAEGESFNKLNMLYGEAEKRIYKRTSKMHVFMRHANLRGKKIGRVRIA